MPAPVAETPAFDSVWNYADPAGTELKLRAELTRLRQSGDRSSLAELLTQVARAQGLQQRFPEAQETLEEAESLIEPDMTTPRARLLLERGRVLNSAGRPDESVPFFKKALDVSSDAGLEFYAADAAHMLAIATRDEESLRWSEEAIKIAEAAKNPVARRWLGPLYNNTGWTYFDMKRYPDALRMFETDVEYRKQAGRITEMGVARWSSAKVLRHMGRIEEAFAIQLELLEQPERKGGENEGYTHEEIGECLLALDRPGEARPHFAQAWRLLREDLWLQRDEPQRLQRLKELGGI